MYYFFRCKKIGILISPLSEVWCAYVGAACVGAACGCSVGAGVTFFCKEDAT
jgi:hypothetical protein